MRALFSKGSDEADSPRKGARLEFDFDELSEGQRALIALYTLLYCVVNTETTVCLDEPDNFLALAEIQPLLLALNDRVDEFSAQVIFVSHHPELIDLLAPEHGVVFTRSGLGPVRLERYRPDALGKLSPSERVAHAVGNVVDRIAEIVVLAEDLRQANLVRHYLICCGHHRRSIVVKLAPPGKGSGEQYVRERYPIEVAYCRQRSHFRKAALAAVLDADTGSVEEHERELRTSLAAAGQERRGDAERIAALIPKRNIETWILCLSEQTVDEVMNYKAQLHTEKMIKAAAVTLYEWNRAGAEVPAACVPSLRKGLGEVRRIC